MWYTPIKAGDNMWLETFNQMRKKSGMSLDALSEKSGIPKGTLTKITSGVTKAPSLETMKSLVYAMGYTLKDLDDGIERDDSFNKEELSHIEKYRFLDPYGKEAVDSVLDVEWRRCREEDKKKKIEEAKRQREQMEAAAEIRTEKIIRFHVAEYLTPMSAGTGEIAVQEYPQDIELIKAPPRGTSFIAHVTGDSMEPTYRDGDMVFVHAADEIPVGSVGVFYMDGQQWIKEYRDGFLISHNPAYGPRPMKEDVRCQGLVLGVCDESYFE